jgi:serine/threonine-protein kinase
MTTMQSVAVAAPILSALNHVHEKGIVHRDVKPPNIFFAVEPDGHVIPKILDFGIAKLPAARSELTVDGSVLGTPHYMSPEQIRGQEDLDGRSDMFSLAVVLYEMLTGVRVFQRDSAAASLAAVLEHEVDPDPRIEPRVWVALSRALAKRPYERFASCGEFANALRQAVDASDEELTHSLQELRPRSDAIPESDQPKRDSLSGSTSRARSRSRKRPGRGRGLLWPLVAASAAAMLAVTGTLMVTRSGSSPARADDTRTTPSTTAADPVAPKVPAPTPSPPVATSPTLATTAPPSVSPPEHASGPSTVASSPIVKPTPLAAAPRLTAQPPAPRPPPGKPPGSPRPVATSAGF